MKRIRGGLLRVKSWFMHMWYKVLTYDASPHIFIAHSLTAMLSLFHKQNGLCVCVSTTSSAKPKVNKSFPHLWCPTRLFHIYYFHPPLSRPSGKWYQPSTPNHHWFLSHHVIMLSPWRQQRYTFSHHPVIYAENNAAAAVRENILPRSTRISYYIESWAP